MSRRSFKVSRARSDPDVSSAISLPLLELHRGDFVLGAEIRNLCRTKGLTVGTIDAQIAAAAINDRCSLLATDRDFEGIAKHFPLRLA